MRDFLRPAVFENLDLFRTQIGYQLPAFVGYDRVNLHEVSVDANNVFLGGLSWLLRNR
jgi:hypothetical protein